MYATGGSQLSPHEGEVDEQEEVEEENDER
jgi:hypothetical protein